MNILWKSFSYSTNSSPMVLHSIHSTCTTKLVHISNIFYLLYSFSYLLAIRASEEASKRKRANKTDILMSICVCIKVQMILSNCAIAIKKYGALNVDYWHSYLCNRSNTHTHTNTPYPHTHTSFSTSHRLDCCSADEHKRKKKISTFFQHDSCTSMRLYIFLNYK